MTKQPEALRLADVLIGSPQFSGTPIWQAADMLRRQHAEITALRIALEQPAVEPVAWVSSGGKAVLEAMGFCTVYASEGTGNQWTPLYAAPQAQQPRKAVKLTNEQPECSTHPDAPHGFDRNRSHLLGRYVCDCEGWMP